MIKVKAGVSPRSIVLVCGVANAATDLGITVTITSGNDSTHMAGSLHYLNAAIDLRIKDLSAVNVQKLLSALKVKFPQPAYDVVLEVDHIHLEDNRAKA